MQFTELEEINQLIQNINDDNLRKNINKKNDSQRYFNVRNLIKPEQYIYQNHQSSQKSLRCSKKQKSSKEISENQFIRKFLEKTKNKETIDEIYSEIIDNQQNRQLFQSNNRLKFRKSRSKSIGQYQYINEFSPQEKNKKTNKLQLTVQIPKKIKNFNLIDDSCTQQEKILQNSKTEFIKETDEKQSQESQNNCPDSQNLMSEIDMEQIKQIKYFIQNKQNISNRQHKIIRRFSGIQLFNQNKFQNKKSNYHLNYEFKNKQKQKSGLLNILKEECQTTVVRMIDLRVFLMNKNIHLDLCIPYSTPVEQIINLTLQKAISCCLDHHLSVIPDILYQCRFLEEEDGYLADMDMCGLQNSLPLGDYNVQQIVLVPLLPPPQDSQVLDQQILMAVQETVQAQLTDHVLFQVSINIPDFRT